MTNWPPKMDPNYRYVYFFDRGWKGSMVAFWNPTRKCKGRHYKTTGRGSYERITRLIREHGENMLLTPNWRFPLSMARE